jgi:hypothetical protein
MARRKPKHWIEKALDCVREPAQPRDEDHDRHPGREQPEQAIRSSGRGRRKKHQAFRNAVLDIANLNAKWRTIATL